MDGNQLEKEKVAALHDVARKTTLPEQTTDLSRE